MTLIDKLNCRAHDMSTHSLDFSYTEGAPRSEAR